MKDDSEIEWSPRKPEGLNGSSGCFEVSLEPWDGEPSWALYMQLDVSSEEEGKMIAEAVLRTINSLTLRQDGGPGPSVTT